MASIVLGVLGRKRSGKDTFAARLVSHHGFTRLAFADALKATMLDLDPLVIVEPAEHGLLDPGNPIAYGMTLRLSAIVDRHGWEAAKEIREVRRILQEHGLAIRNHVDPDVWVLAVERQADAIDGPVVVTDVRFPNEVEWVTEGMIGYTVRITRPGQDSSDHHVSETALDEHGADFHVLNDSTVESLHADADAIARHITH